jgi:hypothetical protein
MIRILFLGLCACWLLGERATAVTDIAGEAFTVKDSIQISYIVEPEASTLIELRGAYPPGSPILSPDGKQIVIVTHSAAFWPRTLWKGLSGCSTGIPLMRI